MKNVFGGLLLVVFFAFTSSAFAELDLPGANTRYCETAGLTKDSFVAGGSAVVGIYDGKWAGQDSSTLVITKVEGKQVEGFYAFGPKQYCEKFVGTTDGAKKVSFTLSWDAKVEMDFGGEFGSPEKPHATYRYPGYQAYGDFPRFYTPGPE